MSPRSRIHASKSIVWVAFAGLGTMLCSFHAASAAPKLTTLYSFCKAAGCSDGERPDAPLATDAAGNLYGTTHGGGATTSGVVFMFERKSAGHYKYRVIDNLCSDPSGFCSDGSGADGGLIVDVNGNVYIAASQGGEVGDGVVFKLSPTKHGLYKNTALFSFCAGGFSCSVSGYMPVGALTYQGASTGALYDGVSPLYGVTNGGGANGTGVAYQLTFSAKKRKPPVFAPFYNFCSASNCGDGAFPHIGMIADAGGNLFGGTLSGGAGNSGVVFELSSKQGGYAESVLHDFCTGSCEDGSQVQARPTFDASGNLYDTTTDGGANNQGTIFELSPKAKAPWKYTERYSFCAEANCVNGASPQGVLTIDGSGNIFGVASAGGTGGPPATGVAYELSAHDFSALYSFCAQENCADGAYPSGGIVSDGAGNMFGTTLAGGAQDDGTIYQITP
jgi:uncharacterized repeat protein (TIGR03803 family)